MKSLTLVLSLILYSCLCSAQSKIIYNTDGSNFSNPERGFYHHTEVHSNNYSFLNSNTLTEYRKEGITLILRVFYLENFKKGAISNTYLDNMRKDFQEARKAGVKVIVRFAYTQKTTKPYGDATLETILIHLKQLKKILTENEDVISLVQAGFIGAWGEWYYTDHFSTTIGSPNQDDWLKRRQLFDALLESVPTSRMVQVRTPKIKTALLEDNVALTSGEAFTGIKKARTAHHNDCFVSSSNDVGTYVNIEVEKAYLEKETRYLVMGGESCAVAEPYSLCPNALAELERFHWSFLNIDYHPQVLASWKTDVCFDDVQLNLGYRYRLVDAAASTISKPGGKYSIDINLVNDGWANVYNERTVEIVLKNQSSGKEYFFKTNENPRLWSLSNATNISMTLGIPEYMESGDYSVFVNIPDPLVSLYGDPNYSIRLANTGVWQAELGYNDLGITLNISESNTTNDFTGADIFQERIEASVSSTTIIIDGDPSEWIDLPITASSSTNTTVQIIKMFNSKDSLYFAALENNLYDTYQLFIDLDKSPNSGYHAWQWRENGAELLIENGIIYSYDGINNEWGWASLGPVNSQKNNSTLELSVDRSVLGDQLTFDYAFVNDPENTVEVNYLPSQNTAFLTYNLFLSTGIELFSGSDSDRILLFWGKTDDIYTRILERSTNGSSFEIVASLPGSKDYYLDFDIDQSIDYQYRYYLTNGINISPYSMVVHELSTDARDKFYELTIDGEDEDWHAIPPSATQNLASAYTLRTFWGVQKAQFILSGSHKENYAIFLDTDNNEATGGPVTIAVNNVGFDYLIYGDSLFQFISGVWEFTQRKTNIETTFGFTELSVGLEHLTNLEDNFIINIVALFNAGSDTVFLPGRNEKIPHLRTVPSKIPSSFAVKKSGEEAKYRLVVSWNQCNNCLGYVLERSRDEIDFVKIGEFKNTTIMIIDDGLMDKTTYYYRMYSYNEIGNSAYTKILSEATGEIVLSLEISEEENMIVYPNPVRDNLHIKLKNDFGQFQLQIFSIWGSIIYDSEVDLTQGEAVVPLEGLNEGIYIVNIASNKKIYRLKFLKKNL